MAIIKVKTGGITADAVTDALIADDVVGTEHLTANEVDTTALGADAVTGAQLADNAVNSEHYTDGSVDTAHIADAQITTAKLSTALFTGATDIGADLADADLILIDDGAGGTIRKAALSRIKTYASGAILQVVVGQTNTNTQSTSATFIDTNLTAAITPSATSSTILVMVDHPSCFVSAASQIGLKLFRGTGEITSLRYILDTNDATRQHGSISFSFIDSPSSTSEVTYKTQFNNEQGSGTVNIQKNANSTMVLMEIAG